MHLPFGITQFYQPPDTDRLYLSQTDLPTPVGRKAELTYTCYIPRQFTRPQMVTHPTTNPVAHGPELNSQPVD